MTKQQDQKYIESNDEMTCDLTMCKHVLCAIASSLHIVDSGYLVCTSQFVFSPN